MGRFPSPVIKVQFEGPDVHEEKLYSILRVGLLLLTLPRSVPYLIH